MASESARAPSRAAALGLVGLLFCAMAALRVCADGTLGPRDLKKAKLVKGGDGSDYYYADNLAPGFASELCKDHGSAIGVFRGPYLQAGGHDRVIVRWSSEAQVRRLQSSEPSSCYYSACSTKKKKKKLSPPAYNP